MGITPSNLFARLFAKKQLRILMGEYIGCILTIICLISIAINHGFTFNLLCFFSCVVGLDDAGKTTILYKLMGDDGKTTSTVPTVGLNVETLQYKNIEFTVWDIDGRCMTTLLSRHYFKNTHGIIFVIDSHDRERLLEARDKLQEMVNVNIFSFLIHCWY